MKKLVYIVCGFGILTYAACNEPATFDQTVSERRADSIADARARSESGSLYAEYDEACSRQLMTLQTTRDSLEEIYVTTTPGAKRTVARTGGTKPTTSPTTTTTPTTSDPNTGKRGEDPATNTGKRGSDQPATNTGKRQ